MIAANARTLGFDPDRLARVGARLDADIATGRYPGAQLKVGRRGQFLLDAVHGDADRAAGRRMPGDETFVSFSIGKQFTNALVLNRIERGCLSSGAGRSATSRVRRPSAAGAPGRPASGSIRSANWASRSCRPD